MRTRMLAVVALLTMPLTLSAQRLPLPHIGRRPSQPTPQSPPEPTADPVAKWVYYQQSRWSGESYTLVSSLMLPNGAGGMTRYSALGAGTHGDYRITDHHSATVDLTQSPYGGPIMTTFEIGTRYKPLPLDAEIRPFIDVRGAFLRMYDLYSAPLEGSAAGAGLPLAYADEARYSRGGGLFTGTGFEYALTSRMALSTEIGAMRSRMTVYDLSGPAQIPTGARYWMTSVRYAFGFRYNLGRYYYASTNKPR